MERGYETVEETIYIPEGFLLLVDLEEGKVVLRKKEKEPIKGLKYQGWKLEFEGEVEEECDDNANTPKFNIGDWIVSDLEDVNEDFRLCKIIGIEDGCYTIQSANGCKGYNFFETWESDYHLWSIKDAKDGDVLACNEEILLFKSYSVQNRISLYCWYNGQTNNFHSKEVVDALMTTRNKICPATKEQCDILFQKMHETGYEWDAENKQLKKL